MILAGMTPATFFAGNEFPRYKIGRADGTLDPNAVGMTDFITWGFNPVDGSHMLP